MPGTVKEVGLFVTAINTPDNVLTVVGNNKIFLDTIQNFSANPYRRVDLKAQLNHSVDHNRATQLLKERLAKIPNVKTDPAPDVEILEFNLAGPVLAVRPYCHMDHYWQDYFDTNRVFANHSAHFQFRSNIWPFGIKRGTERMHEQKNPESGRLC